MFRKLFGETDEEQLQYLHVRSIVTIILFILIIIAYALSLVGAQDLVNVIGGLGILGISIILLFVWGLSVSKRLFGIATLGSLFSRNVVIGVIFFVFAFIVAYYLGIFFAILGVSRYIYLRVKYGKKS